jgi:transcription-repair coupling factor (superfamily II helicase)
VVTTSAALLQKVLPVELLADSPELRPGQDHDPAQLASTLADLGYLGVGRVEDPGTFSRRGDLLDVWPTGCDRPVRLDFFDEELESIRRFDPGSQRTVDACDSVRLLPSREEVLSPKALQRAAQVLRDRVAELGHGMERRRQVLQDLQAGIRFSGVDAWLPALHALVPVWAHLQDVEWVVLDLDQVQENIQAASARAHDRFEALPDDEQPLIPPADRYETPEQVGLALAGAARIEALGFDDALDAGLKTNDDLRVGKGASLAPIAKRLRERLADGWRVALVVDSELRADRIGAMLLPHKLFPRQTRDHNPEAWTPGELTQVVGDLPQGFAAPLDRLIVVTADEIFGEKLRVRGTRQRSVGQAARDAAVTTFAQLKEGDLVVHRLHGIGRFLGLKRVQLEPAEQDMVQLEYRNGRMYLPVTRLDSLSRFHLGEGGKAPRLDRLGGDTWQARKAKVKDAVLKLAHQLLSIEAARKTRKGHAYVGLSSRYRRFADAFPYTETPDQAMAIQAVLDDLKRSEPMDRLVVGDVGFGKTEVALRAAMRVVDEGRQVALLCPTTVLAYQHHRTFQQRFEGFGIRVGLLSRFSTPKEKRALLAEVKAGAVHVVIGTTSLLGRTVRFHDLGLIVIDEEHRYGVAQKARLRSIRQEVDVLALSATPIPRSMYMAVTGLRTFSVITTPPRDRLPIRTAVSRWSEGRIREDLLRELRRGGQAFYVHNRIQTIESAAKVVRAVVPEARIEIAHGAMDGRSLEQVLVRFIDRQFDVLFCTAIIESGIDMPTVNTILVDQAERFGLAQLYQLRGRVGRSHLRGYCTLLVHEENRLTRKATKRLRVLQEYTELGSGFSIATADLDLRGAGDLLGERQHGHIQAVGFETYVALLEEAIDEARGRVHREQLDPAAHGSRATFLTEDWIPSIEDRLFTYKALASARSAGQLRGVLDAAEDQYGAPPVEALDLGRVLEVRIRCRDLGIARCDWLKVRVMLEFAEQTLVSRSHLQSLCAVQPRRFQITAEDPVRLACRFTPQEAEQPFSVLHWVLGQIGGK